MYYPYISCLPVVLPSPPQASKIHSGPGQDNNKKPSPVYVGHDQAATELDPLLSSEEFKKLQLEVERLGERDLTSNHELKQMKSQSPSPRAFSMLLCMYINHEGHKV